MAILETCPITTGSIGWSAAWSTAEPERYAKKELTPESYRVTVAS